MADEMSGDQKTVIKGGPSQYVKLNVGGHLFYVSVGLSYYPAIFVYCQTDIIYREFEIIVDCQTMVRFVKSKMKMNIAKND